MLRLPLPSAKKKVARLYAYATRSTRFRTVLNSLRMPWFLHQHLRVAALFLCFQDVVCCLCCGRANTVFAPHGTLGRYADAVRTAAGGGRGQRIILGNLSRQLPSPSISALGHLTLNNYAVSSLYFCNVAWYSPSFDGVPAFLSGGRTLVNVSATNGRAATALDVLVRPRRQQ